METTTPEEKRKSFLIATCLYGVLLLILFFIRFWPPSDAELALMGGGGGGGVEVNFGDTDLGSGVDYQSKVLDVKDAAKQTQTATTPEEDIIAEDDEADKTDVVIPKNEKPKVVVTKPVIKEEKPVIKPKPKVNSTANSALDNIIKGNKGGDGNSSTAGNQGSANGNINSSGYGNGGTGGGTGGGNGTGNGTGTGVGTGSGSGGGNGSGNGLGNGSGYSLGGRKALKRPEPEKCGNDSGVIVVRVTVDKNGNTISASPGYKGTENPSSCMLAAAKSAAMDTKWEPSPTAADKQVGTIRFVFSIKN